MPPDYTPGQPALLSILVAPAGVPVTDATVVVTVAAPGGTVLVTAQAATHAGNGVYVYTLSAASTAQVGTYTVTWAVTGTATLARRTVFVVDHEEVPAETLLGVRQSTARLVEGENDFVLGTVDAIVAGGMVDDDRIEPKGHWNGAEVYVYDGASAGSSYRVTAYDPSASPDFTTQPVMTGVPSGSRYELHKRLRIDRMNDAIRTVVRGEQSTAFEPIDGTITLSGSTFEYDVPPGFERVHGVEVTTPSGQILPVAPAAWDTKPGRRKLRIASQLCWRWSGCTARILGLRPVATPLLDSSPIEIPGNYVKFAAGSLLAAGLMTGAQGDPWEKKASAWGSLAEGQKDFARRVPNNTKRV